jgi:hypothetical protein
VVRAGGDEGLDSPWIQREDGRRLEKGAAAVRHAESDNAVYRMLPAARRTYSGVASWCRMDSEMLCGREGGEWWPSSLCWNVVGLRCKIQSALRFVDGRHCIQRVELYQNLIELLFKYYPATLALGVRSLAYAGTLGQLRSPREVKQLAATSF